ncbi:MAG: hypothetical protein EZS28_007880, partial [Streblomastix strix]
GTVGQLSGLQPSSGAEGPGLNAGLKPVEAGLISAGNRERTEPQINEDRDENAEEEEDEQTDEAALNQNKDYRVNIISQPPVQENLGTQPQNIQGLNALRQMNKDDTSPAPVEVHEKPKRGKGSKQSKSEGLTTSDEPSQGNNAQAQIKTTSKVPKIKAVFKRGKKTAEENIVPDRTGTLQPREISVEISLWNRGEERADDNGSSVEGAKDLRIDVQREKRWNWGVGLKDLHKHGNKQGKENSQILDFI